MGSRALTEDTRTVPNHQAARHQCGNGLRCRPHYREDLRRSGSLQLAVLEVMALEIRLPVAVRLELIDHQGAVLAAVSHQVRLRIAVQIQVPRHHSAGTGCFQIAVRTCLPSHSTSRGRPTFTEMRELIGPHGSQAGASVCVQVIGGHHAEYANCAASIRTCPRRVAAPFPLGSAYFPADEPVGRADRGWGSDKPPVADETARSAGRAAINPVRSRRCRRLVPRIGSSRDSARCRSHASQDLLS